jgi:hypothetical protein
MAFRTYRLSAPHSGGASIAVGASLRRGGAIVRRVEPFGYTALPVETHGRASYRDGGWMASPSCALKGQHTPAQGNALGNTSWSSWSSWSLHPGRCPGLGYAAPSGLKSHRRSETHGRASLRAITIIEYPVGGGVPDAPSHIGVLDAPSPSSQQMAGRRGRRPLQPKKSTIS